jgi:hypothetical protein
MLTCNLVELRKVCRISTYMTGTTFTMVELEKKEGFTSLGREDIQYFYPTVMLTRSTIKATLLEYWDFEHLFLKDDTEIDKLLDSFVGRPYLFYEGLFKKIFSRMIESCSFFESRENFIAILREGAQKLSVNFASRVYKLFSQRDISTLPDSGRSKVVRQLIAPLITCLLCGDGLLRIRGDDVLGMAVATGIIPVTYKGNAAEDTFMNLPETEPLVAEAIISVLKKEILSNKTSILNLLYDYLQQDEKGKVAELSFAYTLAINNIYLAVANRVEPKFALHTTLLPFFDSKESYFPSLQLSQMFCEVTKVIDCLLLPETNPLKHLILQTGEVRNDCILVNTPNLMGVDLVFVSCFNQEMRNIEGDSYRLVALQSKNASATALNDVLITLHPGTQWLIDKERKAVAQRLTPERPFPFGTYNSSARRTYVEFMNRNPLLSKNWIRIGIFAQSIDEALYQFISDQNQNDIVESPIVLLSLATVLCSRKLADSVGKATVPDLHHFIHEISLDQPDQHLSKHAINERNRADMEVVRSQMR